MTNLDYLYNPEAAKAHFTKNYFVDKKLGFSVIENGIILPHKKIPNAQTTARKFWGAGGIVDKNGTYFKRSFVNNGDGKYYTPPQNQFNTARKPLFILECFVTFGDMPSPTI